MSAPVRLVAFAAVLAAAFAAAVALGSAFGPEPGNQAATHGAAHGAEPAAVAGTSAPGLSIAADGLELAIATTRIPAGAQAVVLRFRVLDEHGMPVRDFDLRHERRMHLIVVRRDLRAFQHLHPRMAPDGTWSVPVRLAQPGSYRVFADFSHGGRATTLGADLAADGAARYAALPAPAAVAHAGDGYAVRLAAIPLRAGAEAALRFAVTRDGHPVTPEPYLGAGGHLVALRAGDLAFLHTHPSEATGHAGDAHAAEPVEFMTAFPSAGRYRLFLQFRDAGEVRTAAFTVAVGR